MTSKNKNQVFLDSVQHSNFQPIPIISGGRRQTLAAYLWPGAGTICTGIVRYVELPCGDKIVIQIHTPETKIERNVILVHGLTGFADSRYMVRMAELALNHGFRVIRMNLRGCGLGRGHARNLYHSGRSDDVLKICEVIAKEYPSVPISLVGYSLGANIILKMAGELGDKCPEIQNIVAVSPPLDLKASSLLISHPNQRLLNNFFIKGLIRDIKHIDKAFPDEEPIEIQKI